MSKVITALLVASALGFVTGVAGPAPARAASGPVCPSADTVGFIIGSGPYGASGVDGGTLVKDTYRTSEWHTCTYRGRYWTVTIGSPKVYPGNACTWQADVSVYRVGLGPRRGVTCS